MHLQNQFAVTAPIDEVWTTLMDFEQVAGCVPGAQVRLLSEDTYEVEMRVKLGPMTMHYRGRMEVVERDGEARRARLRGRSQEVRGQGTAEATVEMFLREDGGSTRGTVNGELKLSGKAAAMGQSVIGSVADQLMAQFAQNLQTLLSAPRPVAAGPAATDAPAGGPPADDERSGATVVEAVGRLAAGSQSEGVRVPPEVTTPKTSPVEQVRGDEQMTRGRPATGSGGGGAAVEVPSGRAPEASVSGGAQSSVGGRVSDRVSGSQQRPSLTSVTGGDRSLSGQAESLDGLALAIGVARAQLRQPRVLIGLLIPVLAGLVGYGLGRRSGR